VLLAGMIVGACSPDDFIEYSLGLEDGAADGVSKSVRTDGSSEQKITLKTGASLTIPAKSLDHAVTIVMERPSDKNALQLVKSVKSLSAIASAPYVLTPHGTQFKERVSLELPVNKDTDKRLVVAWLEDEHDSEWKKLGTPVVKDGIARLELDHFSVVMLMEEGKSGFSADDAQDAAVPGADAGAAIKADGGSTSPDASAPQGDAAAGAPDASSGAEDADAASFVKDAGASTSSEAGTGPRLDDGGAALEAGSAQDSGSTGTSDASTPDAGAKADSGASPVDAQTADAG
jgi:hypothetical protein